MKAENRAVFICFILCSAAACVRVTGPQEIGFDPSRRVTALGLRDLDDNGRPELIAVVADQRTDLAGFQRSSAAFIYLFERSGKGKQQRFGYIWQSGPMGSTGPDGRLEGSSLERIRPAPEGSVLSGPEESFLLSFKDGHYVVDRVYERGDTEGMVDDSDLPAYLGFVPDQAVWLNLGKKDYLLTLKGERVDIRFASPARRNPFLLKRSIKIPGVVRIAAGSALEGIRQFLLAATGDGKILVYGLDGL